MENYLIQPLFEFIRLFDDLGIPYALMMQKRSEKWDAASPRREFR
jgi:hypothetical protein